MKRKFIKIEECKKNILSKEELTFSAQSLVSSISSPPAIVFAAMHGNLTAHDTQGTMYICRIGYKNTSPLKIDAYSFNSKLIEKAIGIKGPIKKHEYHWIPNVPVFMKNDAPKWVKEKIIKALLTDKL